MLRVLQYVYRCPALAPVLLTDRSPLWVAWVFLGLERRPCQRALQGTQRLQACNSCQATLRQSPKAARAAVTLRLPVTSASRQWCPVLEGEARTYPDWHLTPCLTLLRPAITTVAVTIIDIIHTQGGPKLMWHRFSFRHFKLPLILHSFVADFWVDTIRSSFCHLLRARQANNLRYVGIIHIQGGPKLMTRFSFRLCSLNQLIFFILHSSLAYFWADTIYSSFCHLLRAQVVNKVGFVTFSFDKDKEMGHGGVVKIVFGVPFLMAKH